MQILILPPIQQWFSFYNIDGWNCVISGAIGHEFGRIMLEIVYNLGEKVNLNKLRN